MSWDFLDKEQGLLYDLLADNSFGIIDLIISLKDSEVERLILEFTERVNKEKEIKGRLK